jgi:heme/copper-type cytochrome/quinol oxidase subunit 2
MITAIVIAWVACGCAGVHLMGARWPGDQEPWNAWFVFGGPLSLLIVIVAIVITALEHRSYDAPQRTEDGGHDGD